MPTNSNEFANVVLRYEDGTIVKGIAELNDITSYLEEHKDEFARVRHGRWENDGHTLACSNCHTINIRGIAWDYCPYCGAKMDEVEE